jgi:hypothetical protein
LVALSIAVSAVAYAQIGWGSLPQQVRSQQRRIVMTIVYRDSFRDMTAHQERMSRMLLRRWRTQEHLTCGASVLPVRPDCLSERNEG